MSASFETSEFPFPLSNDQFELPFAIRVLRPGQSILRRSDSYDEQLELKRHLSRNQHDYFRAVESSQSAQLEVIDYLNLWSPSFNLKYDGGTDPLWQAGLQVQEDLILLEPEAPFRMIAGAVFFPSGWSVADKIGLSNEQIHAPVPGYPQFLHAKTERLLGGLKYARPVSRDNWGVRPTNQWNQLPKFAQQWEAATREITIANAGQRCFFRGEYQTLSRLKHSNAILFTIHSWQKPVEQLNQEQSQRLAAVLSTCPPESLIYKGIAPFLHPLLAYLQAKQ